MRIRGFPFAARHAARELRSGVRRIGWFMSAVALGIAVLVALYGFREDAAASAREEARALLGGDLRLQSNNAFDPEVEALLEGARAAGARVSRGTSLASVVSVPSTGASRLLQVNAVDEHFPASGDPIGVPAAAPALLSAGGGVVVDPQIMDQLAVGLGDRLRIGTLELEVLGSMSGVPVDFGLQWVVGPPVFLHAGDLEATGILGFGSLAQHRAWIVLPEGTSPEGWLRQNGRLLRSHGVSVRTAAQEAESFARGFAGLARFFGLVGLVALLLGGIGVGSAVAAYLREKRSSMAVLRCLGARQGTLFRAYLLQIGILGALGALAGVAGGILLQWVVPVFVNPLVPFTVRSSIHPEAIVAGFVLGCWVAVVFALLPLLGVRGVSPLVALRSSHADTPAPAWLRAGIGLLVAGSVLGLATFQLGGVRPAIGVTLALVLALGALGGVGRTLGRAVARLVPAEAPFALRQGLSGLGRPGNQSVVVVTALGFGAFLTAAVLVVEHGMRAAVSIELGPDRPSLALFDIQTDQREGVEALLAREGGAPEMFPLVASRLAAVNGVESGELLTRTRPGQGWIYRRVYRNTWSDPGAEARGIVEGSWWDAEGSERVRTAVGEGVARVSLEVELAEQLGVAVGDRLTWDVQGIRVESVVSSLREVDWAAIEPNFFAIFEPGALEGAPATWVALAPAMDAAASLRVQEELLAGYPNVTFLDVTTVQETLERLSGDIALLLRSMAAFILAGGLLVLLASLLTTRFRRRQEAALLKTLGARASTVRGVLLAEYLALGAVGGLAGVLLGGVGGVLLLSELFELPVAGGPWGTLLGLWGAVTLLAVLAGWSVSRPVLRSPAMAVLREDF